MNPYWSNKRFPYAFYAFLRDNGCKWCKTCKRILPLDSFGACKCNADGKSACCNECRTQYNKDNRERKREYNKQYRQDNKERLYEYNKEYRKQYYQDNKERIIERCRQYYQSPHGREVINARVARRRAKKKEVNETWTAADTKFCLERAGHKCESCGMSNEEHKERWNERLHMDHIKPLSEGHALSRNNCQVLCRSCNCSKGNKMP